MIDDPALALDRALRRRWEAIRRKLEANAESLLSQGGIVAKMTSVTKAARGVERAMTKLIKLLASPEPAVQQGAIGPLDAMGVAAIGCLTLGLNTSKDPAYRVWIVGALGALAPLSRTTVLLALADAARDKDPEVGRAVTRVV